MSDKRTQIIEASIDLFAKNGFWNTPTSRITKHAKVSTGTLFNYFASKDELIDEVYLQLRQEQTAHIAINFPTDDSIKSRFEHIWFRYIDWGVRHPVRYRLLQQMKLSSDLISSEAQARSNANMTDAIGSMDQAMKENLFGEISAEYFGSLVLAQLNAAVSYATVHKLTDMSLTKHIARSFEIFWAGVTS
ncbi:MAG: TetR/AcrR family transcriptional regulator [Chloroflexota bacterium]